MIEVKELDWMFPVSFDYQGGNDANDNVGNLTFVFSDGEKALNWVKTKGDIIKVKIIEDSARFQFQGLVTSKTLDILANSGTVRFNSHRRVLANRNKTRNWSGLGEKTTLKSIAKELNVRYETPKDVEVLDTFQYQESDYSYLLRLCKVNGLHIKSEASTGESIIYDTQESPPLKTIVIPRDNFYIDSITISYTEPADENPETTEPTSIGSTEQVANVEPTPVRRSGSTSAKSSADRPQAIASESVDNKAKRADSRQSQIEVSLSCHIPYGTTMDKLPDVGDICKVKKPISPKEFSFIIDNVTLNYGTSRTISITGKMPLTKDNTTTIENNTNATT